MQATTTEVVIVYRCVPPVNASDVWVRLKAAIAHADLVDATRVFEAAALARLRGFYQQDMRRILFALARRAAAQNPELIMKFFPGAQRSGVEARRDIIEASGFAKLLDIAMTTAAQSARFHASRQGMRVGHHTVGR